MNYVLNLPKKRQSGPNLIFDFDLELSLKTMA